MTKELSTAVFQINDLGKLADDFRNNRLSAIDRQKAKQALHGVHYGMPMSALRKLLDE